MNKRDLEDMASVPPHFFAMTDEEVINTAFSIAHEALAPYEQLPIPHQEVIQQNNLRIWATAIEFLRDHNTRYWKQ